MKYEINTDVRGEVIVQTVDLVGDNYPNHMERIIRQVMDTGDRQIRDALIKLGWKPPVTLPLDEYPENGHDV